MCVKFSFRYLNSDPCLPHSTNIYTYRVTTALRVRDGNPNLDLEGCNPLSE